MFCCPRLKQIWTGCHLVVLTLGGYQLPSDAVRHGSRTFIYRSVGCTTWWASPKSSWLSYPSWSGDCGPAAGLQMMQWDAWWSMKPAFRQSDSASWIAGIQHTQRENAAENTAFWAMPSVRTLLLPPPPPQPFYGPFSGTTRVSQCQKKASSGFYGAREDNKRQTHWQSGWASLHLDYSAIHLRQSHYFYALRAATLPIYPDLGQAQEYAGLHTSVTWFTSSV